jgi:hypothetical protein
MSESQTQTADRHPYDLRCTGCDEVYVCWLPGRRKSAGDTVTLAHTDVPYCCGEYIEHEVVSYLSGIAGDSSRF